MRNDSTEILLFIEEERFEDGDEGFLVDLMEVLVADRSSSSTRLTSFLAISVFILLENEDGDFDLLLLLC
jgi:hypothetical protein